MQTFRDLWILVFGSLVLTSGAVEPYSVQLEPSIEEDWRWTELEAISDLQYYFADESVDGDIWFAGTSRTVARFDGSRVEFYNLEDDIPIRALLASIGGDIYILTDKRLLRFNEGVWDTIIDQGTYPHVYYRLSESAEGVVWMSAWGGVFRIEGSQIDFFETEEIQVNGMLVDSNGKVWLSDGDNRRVLVYEDDASKNGVLRIAHSFDFPAPGQAIQLYMDPQGNVWVRDPDRSGSVYYFQDYKKYLGAEGLEEIFSNARAYENANGFRIAALESGRCWFSAPRALVELNGSTIVPFTDQSKLPTSIPCFVPLSNDRLLLGGIESKTYLIDMSRNRLATYSGLNYQCRDKSGVDWFLEHEGRVVTGNEHEGSWYIFGEDDGIIDRPNNIYCSSDGTLWVSGQHAGMAAVSYRTSSGWERLAFPWISPILSHLGVEESHDGAMIFGSGAPTNNLGVGKGGAVVFRKRQGEWQPEILSPPEYPVRPAVIADRENGETWYGGSFLWLREDYTSEIPVQVDLFESRRWTDDMIVDANGELWIAAWGFGVYQSSDNGWIFHSEKDGLATNQVINLLASESMGGIWVANSMGLSRYDGKSWSNWEQPFGNTFSREGITLREGDDGSFWVNQTYRSWLLEGGIQSDHKEDFKAYRYRKNNYAPDTQLYAFQNELPEGSPVVASWGGLDPWSETPLDEMEYSWRLGAGEWSPFSRETTTVLSGIKAGEHLFEVRARDRDWNIDPTPASVTIHMIPPLWKRSWFIITLVATFLFILFLLERLYKMRVRSALAMEEFKLDFFTNISHELRNPLAVILGPLDSLLKEEHSSRTKSRIRLALRNARKMQGLVDQLLQFRKVELGKSTYRPAPGEIVGFIREAVELHEPLWVEKGIQLELKSSKRSHVCSYDADKLQKIVDNLVSNAIKYSDQGGKVSVSIEIETEHQHQELVLIVQDQGRGIPLDKQELVMRPFYRVRKEKSSDQGFGIGLALVSGLVQVCGGVIDLMSPLPEGKQGTRFTVRLPLDAASPSDMERIVEGALEPEDSIELPKNGNDSKVLLVEDNKDLRTFIREELSDCYVILEANNGREGMELALRENPELIVTDVMMPEVDGMELCRQLRAHPETSHVPIIMLTAKSSEEHSIEGVEAGADVFFPKPVNMIKLVAQIENLLELRANMKKRFSEQLVVEPTELEIAPAEQEMLRKALQVVESNMSDPEFDVDQFAREMGMGRTALLKKLKALTGEAPGTFIRSMRLKRAAQLLATETITVSETLDYIGILDPSYFSRVFKKQFGVSPSQYAKGE